jgi:molybdopterin molybdotransferase
MSELVDVHDLVTVDAAVEIIDGVAVSPRTTSVSLDHADGRMLAEDLSADRDYPPFDKALMDGFAIRSADAASEGAELRIIGEIAAGAAEFDRTVGRGEAAAIMTGAPLPAGADAVVPVERCRMDTSAGVVKLAVAIAAGQAVARRGSDIASAAPVLGVGQPIGPAQIAVAATIGRTKLAVFDRPRVNVLSTGNEIVAADATPTGAAIRDCNGPMLASLLRRLGCDVASVDRAPDDPKLLRRHVERAAAETDALFVSGGVSMGKYDHLPAVLRESGFEMPITKLKIKPGKPFVFAKRGRSSFIFGLPGNPVSAFACTLRLASRLLRRMQGLPPEPRWVVAPLAEPLPANGPREFYQPVDWDGSQVRPLAWKGSADVFTLSRATALLVRPENDPPRPAGSVCKLLEVPR